MDVTTTTVARRAKVTQHTPSGDVVYDRVRFVFRDGTGRVFDSNGNLVAIGDGTLSVEGTGPRVFTFTLADRTWTIAEPAGCGCGGT